MQLNVDNLLQFQGFKLIGSEGSYSGTSVGGGCDVNGDGYNDVMTMSQLTGVGYVIYGNAINNLYDLNLSSLLPYNGFSITGITNSDLSEGIGSTINCAGNINGDNYGDIVIGYPSYPTSELPASGISYVLFGGVNIADTTVSTDININQGFYIEGNTVCIQNSQDYYGWNIGFSIKAAGNVNGDSYDDLIVGGPGYCIYSGISYIIYGSDQAANIHLTGSSTQINGIMLSDVDSTATYNYIGYSVSAAGDINNDGFDDVIIGAPQGNPYPGGAYIVYGRSGSDSVNTNGCQLAEGCLYASGATGNDNTGYSVSGGGDINGDGYDDIILSAPYANSNSGVVYVVFGELNLEEITLPPSYSKGFSIYGESGSYSGISVSSGVNINGDDYDDIIIGAPFCSNFDQCSSGTNKVFVIYGSNVSVNINLANFELSQGFSIIGILESGFGTSVSGLKDINNDGYDDVVIGAPYANMNAGITYIIYGSASGFVTATPTSYPSSQPSSNPSNIPTSQPTNHPSTFPSNQPTVQPTSDPTAQPLGQPSGEPTGQPSTQPSNYPSVQPTSYPSSSPSSYPSLQPVAYPTSPPSRPREVIYNINIATALISTFSSIFGAVTLYLIPIYIMKNWGYSYKYVFSEEEKDSLQKYEIGLFKEGDKLLALHKNNYLMREFTIEINNGNNQGISEGLYKIIFDHLSESSAFKKNPVSSTFKYIYQDEEAKYLKENEIGLKYTGSLPFLNCNIFFNVEKLVAFKIINGEVINFPISISDKDEEGIPRTLYQAIANEYAELSNSLFTTHEKNQLREFLLINGRIKPSISVIQKIFCLYTPIYSDLGYLRGFLYGVCLNFFKKIQTVQNPRITEDLFISLKNYLKKLSGAVNEPNKEIVNALIHNEKDLEENTLTFEQAKSSVDMYDANKISSKHSCMVCFNHNYRYDNPILNHPKASEILYFAREVSGIKGVNILLDSKMAQLLTEDLSEFKLNEIEDAIREVFARDKVGNEAPINVMKTIFNLNNAESNYLNLIMNIRYLIEIYPLINFLGYNIVYPLIQNYMPESLQNITFPEISNVMLVTAHMSIGHLYAWQQPKANIPFYIVESAAKSGSFAAKLGVTKFINEYRNEFEYNEQTITTTESIKHCLSTILTYTVPDLLVCAAAKAAMPGYECSDMNLGAKLSFAGSECYWSYKASQEPIELTTADIVVPYIADVAAGIAAYATGCGLMGVVSSVVASDWMSKMVMNGLSNEFKENIDSNYLD